MLKQKILIITHSSPNGLNQRQVMECANVIGFTNHDLEICLTPDQVDNQMIEAHDKIIMIVPEWNASFPWSFKKMIDDSEWPSVFEGKAILLVGTSSTTFGNIMGITHLSHILEWVGASVVERVCIPHIEEKFANDDIKVDERFNNAVLAFANC